MAWSWGSGRDKHEESDIRTIPEIVRELVDDRKSKSDNNKEGGNGQKS